VNVKCRIIQCRPFGRGSLIAVVVVAAAAAVVVVVVVAAVM
jgi:hypothetical protein